MNAFIRPGGLSWLWCGLFGAVLGGALVSCLSIEQERPRPAGSVQTDLLAGLRMRAAQGDAAAQADLGDRLLWSEEPQVQAECADWYRRSAEQGNGQGMYGLATCYYTGRGVAKDNAEGLKWCRLAAEKNSPPALHSLGVTYFQGCELVAQDKAEGIRFFRAAADLGYIGAYCWLGNCYYLGDGVTEDHTEAVAWYRKAAEQFPEGMNNLAYCLFRGEGTAQNVSEAFLWWGKAAERGHAAGAHNLGVCYRDGYGVPVNKMMACMWFICASYSVPLAKEACDRIKGELTQAEIRDAETVAASLRRNFQVWEELENNPFTNGLILTSTPGGGGTQ